MRGRWALRPCLFLVSFCVTFRDFFFPRRNRSSGFSCRDLKERLQELQAALFFRKKQCLWLFLPCSIFKTSPRSVSSSPPNVKKLCPKQNDLMFQWRWLSVLGTLIFRIVREFCVIIINFKKMIFTRMILLCCYTFLYFLIKKIIYKDFTNTF